ncbi:MAG: hypothetical protein ACRD07_08780 [Acidimicrobiales bacterium]
MSRTIWWDPLFFTEFTEAGVGLDALASTLQSDAAQGYMDSWNDLMAHIDEQSAALRA